MAARAHGDGFALGSYSSDIDLLPPHTAPHDVPVLALTSLALLQAPAEGGLLEP